jgi:hypothetical protein
MDVNEDRKVVYRTTMDDILPTVDSVDIVLILY